MLACVLVLEKVSCRQMERDPFQETEILTTIGKWSLGVSFAE